MAKVFIDGKEGTTGLKIFERFSSRKDIEILTLTEEKRKDLSARAEMINASDITFLCLPDTASIEAVSLVKNDKVKIIDASTAHRTSDGWAYGFPELGKDFRENIANGKRVAVPGCHASGFISIVYPLIKLGIMDKDYPVTSFSLTGYSGGGKKMIAEYESEDRSTLLDSPRQYGLTQMHKHLKEMKHVCGLTKNPLFSPIVCDYYRGMQVNVPLFTEMLNGYKLKDVIDALSSFYDGQKMVKVYGGANTEYASFLPSNPLDGRNDMEIYVNGNDERVVISSVFDNLGKGASGAAVQCMNIMLGVDEGAGLI